MRKISWLVLITLSLLGIYFAYETDANYLEFIRATSKVQLIVHEGELQLNKDSAVVNFVVEIINPSPVPMWVEAINYHLSINGRYGGYDYMEEARREEIVITQEEGRKIPLQAKLRADYLKLLLEVREKEQEVLVSISGRVRTGFEIGRSGIKAFYPFGGVIWKENR